MSLALFVILGCAIGADTAGIEAIGTIGDARFWHEHPIQDVHVHDDGTLLSFAGCTVHRWSAEGVLLEKVPLKGCTGGLNDGFFSADGAWVAASGLWTGEQGVWRTTGGPRVHEVEGITWSRFCGGGLWDVDGSKGFRRLDLATGEITHPSGEHGTGFLCVDDAWMLDEDGNRIDLDGSVVELPDAGDTRRVVGQTHDGQAIVYLYEQRLILVDRDGLVEPGVPVVDVPEKVILHDGSFFVLDDGVDHVVWQVGADGRLVGRHYAEGQGLGARAGMGALFVWGDAVWSWAGHRVFPLHEPAGPVDSTYEGFFFDADELYLCHGMRCEVRRLDALSAPPRILELPDRFSDDSKLSPYGRYLGQYDTKRLFRTNLDTGEVHAQPVSEWVDGLSIDSKGHFKWRLSSDDNEDGIYKTRVFEAQDEEEVMLGSWRESWLSDPGWTVLQLGPTMRWPGGKKAGYDDADNWFENPRGLVFLATLYGSGLEVYGDGGAEVASSKGRVDHMGPWGDGAWVGRGQKVLFLGSDLTEKARLTVPWPLGDMAVEGAASPDGRYFAARAPKGTVQVWRLPSSVATPLGELPAPEAMPRHVPAVAPGAQLGAPAFAIAEVALMPDTDWWDGDLPDGMTTGALEALGTLDEPQLLVVAMAAFAPRTQQERDEQLAAVRRLSTGWDSDELYTLKDHFLAVHEGGTYYDEDGDEAPAKPDAMAKQLAAAVKRLKLRKSVEQYRQWRGVQPVSDRPAFGVAGCPPTANEVGATPPVPPASLGNRTFSDSILVRVAADGTPSWVATGPNTRNDAARECFAAHRGPWAPAVKDGAPVDLCVRVPCWEPPADVE